MRRRSDRLAPAVLAALMCVGMPQLARATWPADGLLVRSGVTRVGIQPDIAHGIMLAWNEGQIGTVQRVDEIGNLVFGPGALPVSNQAITAPCASDGNGGMFIPIIAGTTLYLVHVDSAGNVAWTTTVCSAGDPRSPPSICADGAGGAFVTWGDWRPLPTPMDALKVYCQRVDSGGNTLWTPDGVLVEWRSQVVMGGHREGQHITPNGIALSSTGGAILVWYTVGDVDPYNTSSLGSTLVGTDGAIVERQQISSVLYPWVMVSPDGAGGAFMSGSEVVHRLDPTGDAIWSRSVAQTGGNRVVRSMVADGTGGVIVVWDDTRTGEYDVRAQSFSANGTAQWLANGIVVCSTVGWQFNAMGASDYNGGVFVVWEDERADAGDVYAQRITSAGVPAWAANGILLSTLGGNQSGPSIVSSPSGHAIVAWNHDGIYAQRISLDGNVTAVAVPPVEAALEQNYPNPFNPRTTIRFTLPSREHARLSIHRVDGRLVRTLVDEVLAGGPHDAQWDGRDENGTVAPSGVYLYRLTAGRYRASKKLVLLK